MNVSPEVRPIDTESPSPVSDAITGFVLVVLGSLGTWLAWAVYVAVRGAA